MAPNAENLPDSVPELKQLCLNLIGQNTWLQQDVAKLEEMLRYLRHQKFGASSEQSQHPGMKSLFAPAEDATATAPASAREVEVPAHTRKIRERKPLPDNLPREDVWLDLPDDQKSCACCGDTTPLKKVSSSFNEKLKVIPATFVVVRTHRPVYSCPKCEAMRSPPLPPHPIPKSMVTPETLAHIAVSKYVDGLPLYRLEKIFQRSGVEIGRDLMARWMMQLGEVISPLIDLMHRHLLAGNIISMDETGLQVLKEPGRSANADSYMIIQARGDPGGRSIVLFHYSPSRAAAVMKPLLSGFKGILLTDGLDVYKSAVRSMPEVTHAGCWSHARRYFVDAQRGTKSTNRKGSLAQHGLELIDQLFDLERRWQDFEPETRHHERNIHSRAVITQISDWLPGAVESVPEKSLTGKALRYLSAQWPYLVRFLEDGCIPIHNNFVENQIRPYAVGRRSWLFADQPDGALASARLYSLLVTAKVNGLNPYEYFLDTIKAMAGAPNPEHLPNLLPFRPLV